MVFMIKNWLDMDKKKLANRGAICKFCKTYVRGLIQQNYATVAIGGK